MFSLMRVMATRLGTRVSAMRAQLLGFGSSSGTSQDSEAPDDVEVIQPIGFASRPAISEHTEALVLRLGNQVLVLCQFDKSVGQAQLATMDAGEARLYSPKEPTTTIRVRADGSVDVVSKTGMVTRIYSDGQTADKPVAKEGSGTAGHTHAAGTLTAPAGGGPVTGITGSATDTIAVGQGAQKVLVPSS